MMADLEEGELSDSDCDISEQPSLKQVYQFGQPAVTSSNPTENDFRFAKHRESQTSRPQTFRSLPPVNGNSSDDSVDTSDEDSPLWNCKRTKYLNRLKTEGMDTTRSQSPQFMNLTDRNRSSPVLQSPPRKKRANNIWGAVLQEQTLTQTMVGFGVDKDEELDLDNQDRNVESYNYKKAREDSRPFPSSVPEDDMEGSDDDPFGEIVDLDPDEDKEKERRSRKRKRPAKDRLGHHHNSKSDLDKLGDKMYRDYRQKSKGYMKDRLGRKPDNGRHDDIPSKGGRKERQTIDITEDDSVPDVIDAIVRILDEPKDDLITRVVKRLGQKKSIHILRMTEDVEDNGGMMVKNGSRRRSPGGVYLQLLKADPDVTKADVDYIFAENNQEFFAELKRKRQEKKARRRREVQRRKAELARQMAEQNGEMVEGKQNHDDSNNSDRMCRDSDDSDGEEGRLSSNDSGDELSPNTSGEREGMSEEISDRGASNGHGIKSPGGEDMLTIMVDETESID